MLKQMAGKGISQQWSRIARRAENDLLGKQNSEQDMNVSCLRHINALGTTLFDGSDEQSGDFIQKLANESRGLTSPSNAGHMNPAT